MIEILNLVILIVALGIAVLFAAFFIVAGLHKKEIWEEFLSHIVFKQKGE